MKVTLIGLLVIWEYYNFYRSVIFLNRVTQ